MSNRIALGVNTVDGFGDQQTTPPAVPVTAPWKVAVATSMLSAATGWAIEAVARKVRGR